MQQPISNFDPVGSHTLQVIAKAGKFNRWMYEEFKPFLKGEVLEIGSGIGNISNLAISDKFNITLSDYNSEYVEWLKANFGNQRNVRQIVQLDLLHPRFEERYNYLKEKFDSIFLLNVIEHLERDEEAVNNCRFLLKDSGHLTLLAPAHQWLYCGFDKQLGHHRRYSMSKMKKLLEKGSFKVVKKQFFNFAGIGGWLVLGKLFRRKKLDQGEMSAFNRLVPVAKFFDKLFFKKIGLSIIITGIKNPS